MTTSKPKIIFEVGGADFHPSRAQAEEMSRWIGDFATAEIHDGASALDALEDADLLILMSSHEKSSMPPSHSQRQALHRWREQGKPLLIHHGFIMSWHEHWPELIDICGMQWVHGSTWHPEIGQVQVQVEKSSYFEPGLPSQFSLHDETYLKIKFSDDFSPEAFLATEYEGQKVQLAWAGHQGPGSYPAAAWAYVALGHDLESFKCEALKQLWIALIHWALRPLTTS